MDIAKIAYVVLHSHALRTSAVWNFLYTRCRQNHAYDDDEDVGGNNNDYSSSGSITIYMYKLQISFKRNCARTDRERKRVEERKNEREKNKLYYIA